MRRKDGRETWNRLLDWDKGSAAAERLAALILLSEGYNNLDPSHPLGGRDGLKDMKLSTGGKNWIGAVYFPRGQMTFNNISEKFEHDVKGVKSNNANGIVFITNQELRLAERQTLKEIADSYNSDLKIYHLEILADLLNLPKNYGIRMEFLDIEMTKEEQLSFFEECNELKNKYEIMEKTILMNLEYSKKIYDSITNNDELRSIDEISKAETEFYEKIWLDRHLMLMNSVYKNDKKTSPEILRDAQKSANEIIKKYGEENVGPYSDFEWGMINGKLSALRWVLGCDWDMLDT